MEEPNIVSSGVAALDRRIGGLARGRYYLLSGLPGSGKTTAALQFIDAGLKAGETCALLTQDDPADLLAQGDFLGVDLRTAEREEKLIILRFRLDFARNYSRSENARAVMQELEETLSSAKPSRLVIDSVLPFLDGGRVSDAALAAFQKLLERGSETTLLLAPGDLGKDHYLPIYDRLVVGVGGILDLELKEGQVRELNIRKLRHGDVPTELFRFEIRPGSGIVEWAQAESRRELPPEVARRLVVLDPGGQLGDDVREEIESAYEVAAYRSVEKAFAELAHGRFGALLVTLDPLAPEPVLEFIQELRRSGNGAPVLLFSRHVGLRSSTRAKGLRAGGDDVLTDALSPQEILHRIGLAQQRGHRSVNLDLAPEPLMLQPLGEDGEPMPLPEPVLRAVVLGQMAAPRSAFALVLVWPGSDGLERGWRTMVDSLRTAEGDLVTILSSGQLALYIHNIRRTDLDSLLARLSDRHPGSFDAGSANIYCYPRDRAEIENWLGSTLLIGASI